MKKSLILGLFSLSIILTACASEPAEPGEYANLAQCLDEKGAVMYGAEWCPHCNDQKDLFGTDKQFVPYQECDPAYGGDRAKCQAAGVTSYPTWIIPGFDPLVGTQRLDVLAEFAGCTDTLPAEEA